MIFVYYFKYLQKIEHPIWYYLSIKYYKNQSSSSIIVNIDLLIFPYYNLNSSDAQVLAKCINNFSNFKCNG